MEWHWVSAMLQSRFHAQGHLANEKWNPFFGRYNLFLSFGSLSFLFLFFERKKNMNKVGRELGKIWEELEEGKNINKVHCMKTLLKMKNFKKK